MKILAPTHPLIHAFLLQEGRLDKIKNIIVESEEYAEKLTDTINTLTTTMHGTPSSPSVYIKTRNDILRVEHYDYTGIYTTNTVLHPSSLQQQDPPYILKKGGLHKERDLLEWLDKNGFTANSTREAYTYFRQGDTITIVTSQGVLQMSFLGNTLEEIYLDQNPQESFVLIGI